MTFTPDVKAMLFDGSARLTRASETLTGDRATLYLTEDESTVRLIELRGRSAVAPVAGRTSDLPAMDARDIDLAFYDGQSALEHAHLAGNASMRRSSGEAIEAGDIRFRTAPDGKTLTRLDAAPEGRGRVTVRMPTSDTAPARTITGGTLAASGDERKGLTAALFDGGVEFVETTAGRGGRAGVRREGTSRRLTLVLKGQLDAIEQARFEDAVEFTAGGVHGFGDIGLYRASAGEIDLQPSAGATGKRATVRNTDAGVTVEARELITVFLDTQNLHARGDVDTLSAGSRTKKPAASTSIFNATDSIYGSAAEFRYDDSAARAEYRGTAQAPARLVQGSSNVRAEYIEFFRESQDLRAKGQVNSTFDIVPTGGRTGDGPAASGKYNVTADLLVYTEKQRTARYTGSVRLENTEGAATKAVTTAGAMDLVLAREARTLDRLEATVNVHAVLSGGREARGDRLVYDANDDLYQLWGKPLSLLNRETDGTCYTQEGNVARFRGELGAPDFPAAENADGGAPRRAVPCPAPAAR
jgi:lipopolysaccharide export system protein LptA